MTFMPETIVCPECRLAGEPIRYPRGGECPKAWNGPGPVPPGHHVPVGAQRTRELREKAWNVYQVIKLQPSATPTELRQAMDRVMQADALMHDLEGRVLPRGQRS